MWFSDIVSIINLFVNDIHTIMALRSVNKALYSYSYSIACTDEHLQNIRKNDTIVELIYTNSENAPILPNLRLYCATLGNVNLLANHTYHQLRYLYIICTLSCFDDNDFMHMPNLIYIDYTYKQTVKRLTNEAFKHVTQLQYLRMSLDWEAEDEPDTYYINDTIFSYLPNLKFINCSKMTITGSGPIPKTLIGLVIGCEYFDVNNLKSGQYNNLKYLATCHYVQLPKQLKKYLPNLIYFKSNEFDCCQWYERQYTRKKIKKCESLKEYKEHDKYFTTIIGSQYTYISDNQLPFIISNPDYEHNHIIIDNVIVSVDVEMLH